ncbi:class I SAM-dependent methyltransferase [Candidatus Microgenomates bacterium]|nr:class I SAM-dependent methyltransferase [Candidatus Microgenomates bacterium]
MMKTPENKTAEEMHEQVPPNWYFQSLKIDPLQRYWHRRRFDEVQKLSERAETVLDIGCADGVFSKKIYEITKSKKYIGIDVLKSSIDWAKNHWKKNKAMQFKVGDAHELKYNDNTFDAVYIMEVLEHVKDPVKVLKNVKRMMKKNGYGVFLVPSDSNLFNVVWWLWLHFHPRGWVWRDTHIQTYRDNYLIEICKKAGFKIEVDKKFILGMLHLVKVRNK